MDQIDKRSYSRFTVYSTETLLPKPLSCIPIGMSHTLQGLLGKLTKCDMNAHYAIRCPVSCFAINGLHTGELGKLSCPWDCSTCSRFTYACAHATGTAASRGA
jgi:hypothetical protein